MISCQNSSESPDYLGNPVIGYKCFRVIEPRTFQWRILLPGFDFIIFNFIPWLLKIRFRFPKLKHSWRSNTKIDQIGRHLPVKSGHFIPIRPFRWKIYVGQCFPCVMISISLNEMLKHPFSWVLEIIVYESYYDYHRPWYCARVTGGNRTIKFI